MGLTELTKQYVIDFLREEDVSYHGKMDELEFLRRIFDLTKIPSNDPRYKTFVEDLQVHRYQFPDDWQSDWIYIDSRFKLGSQSDEVFLAFLCQLVHPFTRRTRKTTQQIVNGLNRYLKVDGVALCKAGEISDSPYFESRPLTVKQSMQVAIVFNTAYIQKQISRMESAIEKDPELAIGTAKEFIETVCKTVLAERGKPLDGTPDISTLTKETLRELQLVPEGVPDESRGKDVIKRLLRSLGSIANDLAELRGLYGTGHGKAGETKSIETRHAKLAVGASATLATFIFETHKQAKS